MLRWRSLVVAVFASLSLLAASCAPGVSVEEYEVVKADLDKANAKLAQTKADLAKATDELAKVQTALDEANAALTKGLPGCLEEVLKGRRSVREYANSPLTKDEVMKLLWAGQGITGEGGLRTAPSANVESPPLRIYLVVGNVENLAPGVYRYIPTKNELAQVKDGDMRDKLLGAAGRGPLGPQVWVKQGAIDIVIAAVYDESVKRYAPFFGEERGKRYVLLEAGHAAQNICLMATALNLSLVTVGGFDDAQVSLIVGLSKDENPLYIIPVGRKK